MTLCGVLKDILLVAASVMIWATPISLLQYLGYGLALCGLIYYKLGAATIKAQLSELNRYWAEYGTKRPVLRKLIVLGLVLSLMVLAVITLAPAAGYDTSVIKKVIKDGGKAD